ncbi:MAG: hypothetical protein D6711_03295 [Chloroflexi bacterium]|nr:MAG: hypothetical protein D6711_03295 [Chloroflexota bacterium]
MKRKDFIKVNSSSYTRDDGKKCTHTQYVCSNSLFLYNDNKKIAIHNGVTNQYISYSITLEVTETEGAPEETEKSLCYEIAIHDGDDTVNFFSLTKPGYELDRKASLEGLNTLISALEDVAGYLKDVDLYDEDNLE